MSMETNPTIISSPDRASDNQDEEFTQVINSLWAAWSRKDIAALEALAAEDYVEFSGSTARTVGKANVAKAAQKFFQNNSINAWTIRDLMVQRYGDTAVCSYYWTDSVTIKGKEFSFAGAATEVLVKQDDKWKYVHHHETFAREH